MSYDREYKINDDVIKFKDLKEYSINVSTISLNDDHPLNCVFLDSVSGPSLKSLPKDFIQLMGDMKTLLMYGSLETIENLSIYETYINSYIFWIVFNERTDKLLSYPLPNIGCIQQTVYFDNFDFKNVICFGPCLFCGKNFSGLPTMLINSIVNAIKFVKFQTTNSTFCLNIHDLYNTLKEEKNVQKE